MPVGLLARAPRALAPVRTAAWGALAGLLTLAPAVPAAAQEAGSDRPEAGPKAAPDSVALYDDPHLPGAQDGTWTANWENDIFGGTDRNYTNGNRLSYVSPEAGLGGLHGPVARALLFADEDDRVRWGLAVGQSLYTPRDTEARRPLPDQHPYAGWVYGEYAVYAQDRDSLRMIGLQAGLVGPSAQGEWVQNNVHELVNSYEVNGWDNQLEDEPAFTLMYERKERALIAGAYLGLELDVVPHVGVALGTLRTQASAGATLRFGDDLKRDFGPPRIRPAMGGSGYFEATPSFNWYLFVGTEGRAVARNLFLDGNTWTHGPSVDKKPFVAELQYGLVLQYDRVQLAWTFVTRSRQFEQQERPQQFGAVSLSVKF
jgi:hypothetical protein